MEQLTKNIQNWSIDKGLDKAEPPKQMLKLVEELGELAEGIVKDRPEQIKDSIGDVYVVLTILEQQLQDDIGEISDTDYHLLHLLKRVGALSTSIMYKYKETASVEIDLVKEDLEDLTYYACLDYQECIEYAWNEIKDRKGKMIDGTFVKESDLK